MGWYYLSIPKLQRLHRWSLGIDEYFHLTLYNGWNYLSMLGLKLNHVSKRVPGVLIWGPAYEICHLWAGWPCLLGWKYWFLLDLEIQYLVHAAFLIKLRLLIKWKTANVRSSHHISSWIIRKGFWGSDLVVLFIHFLEMSAVFEY